MHKTLPLITITVRSTHNPGDVYIGTGLQWLVEQVTGEGTPWQLVDKIVQERFEELLPEIKKVGIALYGGTPQYNNYSHWKFWYDDELWKKYINPNRIRVAVFAGGAGHVDPHISPEEFADHCISDRKTVRIIRRRAKHALCFTTRDQHSHVLLNRLGIANTLLPCTATFSGFYYRIAPTPVEGRVAIVPPMPTFVPNTTEEHVIERFLSIHKEVKAAGFNPVLVCHWDAEYKAFRELLPENEIFYTNDYHALLKYYGTCEGIISARLHATLPAWGIGSVQRVVNVSIDSRGNAAELVGVPNLGYSEATPERVMEAFTQVIDNQDRTYRLVETIDAYTAIIRDALIRGKWLNS
ncbi:MAG: polysaccharide pyruvyl transferase family protein [Ignavibacteriae bacterium]|nr:polysaccharide pyruvyl transferase family protein [Ignavibacteriota bacterium]MCB9216892.1 polysaccharide pyruvyl transferase family protein [Ignavibacteria bacterium]